MPKTNAARPRGRGDARTIAMMCESDALGGAEMVILRLAAALRARGYRIVGVGPDEQTQPDRGSNGWLRERFREDGHEWRTYRKRRPIDPGCVRNLEQVIGEVGADVVHSHEFGMAVYGTAATRRSGVPHVISMHGNMSTTMRWTRRAALRWAFGRSRATVAVSEGTRQHLESTLGLRPGRVSVIRNGVPERPGDRERGRAVTGSAPGELLIVAVGSLIERKGHRQLLEALASLPADAPAWRLAIAGTGPARGSLEELVASLGLEGRARLLGPREDIPDLLAAADVFAMPSIWEGLPLALLEAMFAGRAIIASDVAGIPEAVTHETDGLLIAPGDVSALAAGLLRLLRDAPLRARLGAQARQRARQEFSMDAMTDAYESHYFGERGL